MINARAVHPLAWWAWGIAIGAAAVRVTNPLLGLLLMTMVAMVVVARRQATPWSGSFTRALRLAVMVLVVRMVLVALFAPRVPGHVLFTLPSITLGSWAVGVNIGGPVTREALLIGAYETLRLIGLLTAVAAASSLADPYRLLRALPHALHEAGVAVTVALSLAPQAGAAAAHEREARRLRGRPTTGFAAARGVALPVLEGALERSVAMAASMDARGFGRRNVVLRRGFFVRAAPLSGVIALAVGTYGVLDHSTPPWLGLGGLLVGAVLVTTAFVVSGSRSPRTRYRPDPWAAAEWVTVVSGLLVFAGVVAAGRIGIAVTSSPDHVPGLPLLPAVACLCAAFPAVLTPEPPR